MNIETELLPVELELVEVQVKPVEEKIENSIYNLNTILDEVSPS